MKPGVDVLVGPGCPINLLRDEAKRVGSPFYTLNDILSDDELLYKNNGAGTTADIDNLNTDISRAALKLLRNKSNKLSYALNQNKIYIDEGLSIRPPCRFELFKWYTFNYLFIYFMNACIHFLIYLLFILILT